MSQGHNHQVAGRVGKFVQDQEVVTLAKQDQVAGVVVFRQELTEDAAGFPAGRCDVLEAPGAP